ncbi:hypothetical protein JTB14_018460 [Gonioctena quinquepunctata]|nr:hypothetical protein JTB14_018460 [Gonioctena quinquepunctata]
MSLNDSAVTKIIAELNETKEELKNSIKASEDRLKRSIEKLKHKMNDLEAENLTLKNKLEVEERKNKSNILVIFGFEKDPAEISPQIVINELNKLLEVNVDIRDINNIYCLGKNKNCPIKVEFVTQSRKKGILQKTRKLKNTGVSILHDSTTIQQEELKVLKRHLGKERKLNSNKKSFIKGYIDWSRKQQRSQYRNF